MTFGVEHLILLVAVLVGIYFLARPESLKKKKEKKMKEIHPKGLPSKFPSDCGGFIP